MCIRDSCIENQKLSTCHACDTPGCWTTNPACHYRARPRPSDPDARTDGRAAPDIFRRAVVKITRTGTGTFISIDDSLFSKGTASGWRYGTNNCLIHTLVQCIDIAIGNVDADIPWIREQLCCRYPANGITTVTASNFLDLSEHWKDIVDLIGMSARARSLDTDGFVHHEMFTLTCVDEMTQTLGTVEGFGYIDLYLLNEGNLHFVPIIPA